MHPTTVKKAWSDGDNLYNHARAVIVLNEKGDIVETIDRVKGFVINVLAILGPVFYNGEHLDRAVRSEIGFGRATPYMPAESNILGTRVWITDRAVVKPLSNKEEHKLLPAITKLIQHVIDKEVEHWKRVTYVKSRHSDPVIYTRGKFITVPPDLPLLTFLCLARDMKTRTSGHLKEFADRTWLRLHRLRPPPYPPKKLKRLKSVQHTASNLNDAKYGTLALELIKNMLGKREGDKVRMLFEQILEVYKIAPDDKKLDMLYLELRQRFSHVNEEQALKTFPLDVVTQEKRVAMREIKEPRKRPPKYRHAKGCIRVEVRPSKEAVEKHGMQQYTQSVAD
jgi:hypothetical protein